MCEMLAFNFRVGTIPYCNVYCVGLYGVVMARVIRRI